MAEARVFEEAKSRASKTEIGGVFRMWTVPDEWTRLIESVQMGHEMKARDYGCDRLSISRSLTNRTAPRFHE